MNFENDKTGFLLIDQRGSVDEVPPLEGVTFTITTTTGMFLPDNDGP